MENGRVITDLAELKPGMECALLYAYDYENGTVMTVNTDSVQFRQHVGNLTVTVERKITYPPTPYNENHLHIKGGWSTRGFFSRLIEDEDDYNRNCANV